MKKMILWAVWAIAVCMSLSSCSDDLDEAKKMAEHLCGVQWKEYGSNRLVRMYKNHLVETWTDGKVVGGQLTYDDNTFYGYWTLVGNKLTTTFTAGNNTGFDQNMLMHGTMTVGTDAQNEWHGTNSNGSKYTYFDDNISFTDYSDETVHDRALHGVWHMKAYFDDMPINCTMTVFENGIAQFSIPELNENFTTPYTTRNGHVTFGSYLIKQNEGSNSFIYVRNEIGINLLTEDKAVLVWRWNR